MPPGRLNRAITDAIENFHIGDRVKNKSVEMIDDAEKSIDSVLVDLLQTFDLTDIENENINIRKFSSGDNRGAVGVLAIIPAAIGMIVGVFSGLARPFANIMEYRSERSQRSMRLSIAETIIARRRELLTQHEYENEFADLGVNDKRRSVIEELQHYVLDPTMIATLWRKGKLTRTEYDELNIKAQVDTKESNLLQELLTVIPGIQDLISFTVREAFNDDVARRFGYDEAYPIGVEPYAEKQGLSAEWVKRYWRAHWQLPSPESVKEMYHRLRPGRVNNPFTESDLDTYLQIADIAPKFRDWIKQTSFLPATRVDARRFVEHGIVEPREAFEIFLDQGQSPENAQHLVELGQRIANQNAITLTRAAILKLYRKHSFTYQQANDYLVAIGEHPESAIMYLSLENLALEEERIENELDRIEFEYVNMTIDTSEAHSRVGMLNLPSDETIELINRWEVKRLRNIQLPSKSDYEQWRKQALISDADYSQGLAERGYRTNDIQLYLRSLLIEIAESAEKESERAAKESERATNDVNASQYRRETASIEKQIAESKSAIASIKLALYDVSDESDANIMSRRVLEIEKQIAELNILKANVKLSFETK